MLTLLYYRVLLAILPTIEDHLRGIANLIDKIEAHTDRLERSLEEEAVKLANDAQARREAVDALNAAYDRKQLVAVRIINGVREEIAKAEKARVAVSQFLENLGGADGYRD